MKSVGLKKVLLLPVGWILSAAIMLHQLPGFAAEQVNPQNQVKNPVNYTVKDVDMDLLKLKLRESMENVGNFSSKTIDLNFSFNAFPSKAVIDLTLRDMDIPSVLRIIAKHGGKNIVIDESVHGTISAELKNVSLNEAMQTILTSQELEARVSGNTIFVASRPAMARKGLNRKFIKAFKLNNSNAVEVARILEASVFNKGYTVNNSSGGSALQAIQPAGDTVQASQPDSAATQKNPDAEGTTTGQSTLVGSKTITGRVETLESGSGFADAGKLASTIKIQNVKASTQNITINNNDNGAIAIPDTRTNSILIAGLQEDIVVAKAAIDYLDKPLPQVQIKVSLVELTKTDSNDLGLSISGRTRNFPLTGGFNTIAGNSSAVGMVTGADNAAFGFSTVKNLSDEIAFKINALVKNEKAKLLADPTILALDNSESLIKITDQIISRMTITSQAQTGTITYTPELADIGIVLNILPKVGSDGYVTMKIRPSITSFLKEVSFDGGKSGYANLISTREVILQDARVKAGETLAIGGLIKDNEIESISKIPFAGDLPVFGKLFRNKTLDRTKTELVILITPKIIDDIASN